MFRNSPGIIAIAIVETRYENEEVMYTISCDNIYDLLEELDITIPKQFIETIGKPIPRECLQSLLGVSEEHSLEDLYHSLDMYGRVFSLKDISYCNIPTYTTVEFKTLEKAKHAMETFIEIINLVNQPMGILN